MNSANQFLTELIHLADERGWMLIGYRGERPCSVTLADSRGCQITITDEFGLSFKEYLARLEPANRRRLELESSAPLVDAVQGGRKEP